LSITAATTTVLDIQIGNYDLMEKTFGSSQLDFINKLGFFGTTVDNLKPAIISRSSSGFFDFPWMSFANISVDFYKVKIVHNFADDNWVEMLSSYPLFVCDEGSFLTLDFCDFVMGENFSSVNGIVVCRSAGVVCTFTECSFVNLYVSRTSFFYDGGNSSIYLSSCLIENLTSSCLRGSIYYTLNLTLEHNIYFTNTTILNVDVSSATYGGLVYFVSSITAGSQIFSNCSVSNVRMALQNPNAAGGGVLCYASARH
jgi:hypothetical protein